MRYTLITLLVLSVCLNGFLGARLFLQNQTEENKKTNEALRTAPTEPSQTGRDDGADTSRSSKNSPDGGPLPQSPSYVATLPPAGEAQLFLNGVRFYWTDSVYADVGSANAILKTTTRDGLVDFDSPSNLQIYMKHARVLVDYSVLTDIMNGRVFGHDGSHVRNMIIDSVPDPDGKGRLLRIRGELDLITWLEFEMKARMKPGQEEGALLVEAVEIKSLGLPFVKSLLGTVGMELESLIVPEQGTGVTVRGNTIRIFLPEFFPDPSVFAGIESVDPSANGLILVLGRESQSAKASRLALLLPDPEAAHYLYAAGRFVKFGSLRLIATSLQMLDTTPEDPFHFHMQKYFTQLDRSTARVQKDGRVRVYLLDYDKL